MAHPVVRTPRMNIFAWRYDNPLQGSSVMQVKNGNHVASTGRTRRGFFRPVTVMAALSLCLPFGGAHGQPADAPPNSTGASQVESRTEASLTVTQALQGILALIRVSNQVTDMTPDAMHRSFGVQTKATAKDSFGYGQRLPGNWAFGIERFVVPGRGTQVELGFDPIPGMQAAPLTACEPNFAQFTAALESLGFNHRTRYGEHGRRISEIFWRQEISVEVAPYRAFSDNGEPLGPACVRTVRVR